MRAWLKIKVRKQERETGVEEEHLFVFTFVDAIKSSSASDAIQFSPGTNRQGAWETD